METIKNICIWAIAVTLSIPASASGIVIAYYACNWVNL